MEGSTKRREQWVDDNVAPVYCQGQFFARRTPPQPEIAQPENGPAAMHDDAVSQRYGRSCSQPEVAQPCYSYSRAAPAAVDQSFLLPLRQQPDDGGVYLNGVGYASGYAMPLEMMPPALSSGLLEMMPPAPEFEDGAPSAKPWAGSEDGAASSETSSTGHCHTGADLEISNGDPSCWIELEFCAQFMEG